MCPHIHLSSQFPDFIAEPKSFRNNTETEALFILKYIRIYIT